MAENSSRKFKFISPGVFIDEVDNSQLPQSPGTLGPLVIGRSLKGPANKPVLVSSFSAFVETFGNPVPGGKAGDIWRDGDQSAPTYAAYAAQAWLRNGSPLSFMRVLGDQDTNATSVGKAGWKVSPLTANGNTGNDAGGVYALCVWPSASISTVVSGAVAAQFYLDSGRILLSGTVAASASLGAPTLSFSGSTMYEVTDIDSLNLIITGSSVPGLNKKVTVSLNPNSENFIRKVLNTNPTITNSAITTTATRNFYQGGAYFLGESFERSLTASGSTSIGVLNSGISSGKFYAAMMPMTRNTASDGGWDNTVAVQQNDFEGAATRATTGWFIAQDLSDNHAAYHARSQQKLFRLEALTAGEAVQREVKISISNVKAAEGDYQSYGSFSVLIRSIDDTDGRPQIIERFDNLSLNPASPNYIARIIGDKYDIYSQTELRNVEYGQFENVSNYIRVVMDEDVAAGSLETRLLPFGVFGPLKYRDVGVTGYSSGFSSNLGMPLSGTRGSGKCAQSMIAGGKSYGVFGSLGHAGVSHDVLSAPGQSATQTYTLTSTTVGGGGKTQDELDLQTLTVTGSDGTTPHTFTFTAATLPADTSATIIGVNGLTTSDEIFGQIVKSVHLARKANDVYMTASHTVGENYMVFSNLNRGTPGNGTEDGSFRGTISGSAVNGNDTLSGVGVGSLQNIGLTGSGKARFGKGVVFGGGYDFIVGADWSGSIQFPSVPLRQGSTWGTPKSNRSTYWGSWTGRTATDTFFSPEIPDCLRIRSFDASTNANPASTDHDVAFETTALTGSDPIVISWVFSLDNIAGTAGTGYTYQRNNRLNGLSVTAQGGNSYKSPLSGNLDRFTTTLHGGSDGYDITEREPFRNSGITTTDEKADYALFSLRKAINIAGDVDGVQMNAVTIPGVTNATVTDYLLDMVQNRSDALALIDIPFAYTPDTEDTGSAEARNAANTPEAAATNLASRSINNSYGATYYPWVQIQDTSTNQVLWAPPSVAALGVLSSTDRNQAPWFAPAGFTRGGLSEGAAGIPVLDVSRRLSSDERDRLYEANINPVAKFPAEGIVIFGQKTMQQTASALDRINVRRLMIYLKREISFIASRLLFAPNTQVTWDRFTGQAIPLLEGVKAQYGIEDFRLILDESTTTPDLIDRNIIYAKLLVKPTRSVEFFAIDFVVTNSGASFEE
tara:strand:- start:10275 stop:13814 length:3540 start_codon:yes stop_codon:yes gene_type:complete